MTIDSWFVSFEKLADIAVSALVLFAAMVLLLRVFGKRSTSKMNNFDWIATVAVGSIAASGILLDNVSIADTLVAVTCLMSLQWLLHKGVVHVTWICKLVQPQPKLLLSDGALLHDNMKSERVSEAELMSALREAGLADRTEARWVVLESDASLSVGTQSADPDGEQSTLSNVANPEQH